MFPYTTRGKSTSLFPKSLCLFWIILQLNSARHILNNKQHLTLHSLPFTFNTTQGFHLILSFDLFLGIPFNTGLKI